MAKKTGGKDPGSKDPYPWGEKAPTGYYILCPLSQSAHKGQALALPIVKGRKGYFTRCLSCGTMIFIGKSARWSDSAGLSREDAIRLGATILALP